MLDEEHVRTNEDDWFKSTNAELAAPCSDLQLLRLFERNVMPKTRLVDAMQARRYVGQAKMILQEHDCEDKAAQKEKHLVDAFVAGV